jgi:hypothetical protein
MELQLPSHDDPSTSEYKTTVLHKFGDSRGLCQLGREHVFPSWMKP